MSRKKKIDNFSSAMTELKEISKLLEDENTDIDKIETMIIRTKELVEYCREKLRSTEEKINTIVDQM